MLLACLRGGKFSTCRMQQDAILLPQKADRIDAKPGPHGLMPFHSLACGDKISSVADLDDGELP